MDSYKSPINIISQYYKTLDTRDMSSLISYVCQYFDEIKFEKLTQGQIKFLISFANIVGIPQYIDLLREKYQKTFLEIEDFDVSTLMSKISEAELTIESNKLHRYQKQVLNLFNFDCTNRYILSAPTSFGKTFLVYEIIKKIKYYNIVLIFPTISLLSENFEKLMLSDYSNKLNQYSLHTLSDDHNLGEKNIWLFTPERFLSFIDKYDSQKFDFIFIDEVYKIDNEFLVDQENTSEHERDVAYRIALEFATQKSKDLLLAGPYMEINSRNSFSNFVKDKEFEVINYNTIEIVNKKIFNIKSRLSYDIDGINVPCGNISRYEKVYNFLKALTTPDENTIVYNNYKSGTETYARNILDLMASDSNPFIIYCENEIYNIFIEHLIQLYGEDWIVIKALKCRIGIHHGLVPKYIQKEIINLFNIGVLQVLISTTTITEGVNTSAKNIIITSSKKGRKILRTFDAKNVAGRAGRFLYHFSGRVIDINTDFERILTDVEQPLAHKNFDIETDKNDVDFLITNEKYLNKQDLIQKEQIESEIKKREIPDDVISKFKVIGPVDKISLFDRIQELSELSLSKISNLIKKLNINMKIDWDGFQVVVDVISPYIKDAKLSSLSNAKCKDSEFSIITAKLHYYLIGGFQALLEYNKKFSNIDVAMRETADIIYNVFKYQLVKYLGVFDLLYRYVMSLKKKTSIEDIPGISRLLNKLEHNALSENARKLNDYGVPFKLIDYYDGVSKTKQFDAYEAYIDTKISNIIV